MKEQQSKAASFLINEICKNSLIKKLDIFLLRNLSLQNLIEIVDPVSGKQISNQKIYYLIDLYSLIPTFSVENYIFLRIPEKESLFLLEL